MQSTSEEGTRLGREPVLQELQHAPSGNLPAAAGLVVLGISGTLVIERAPGWRHPSTVDNGARRVRVVGIFVDPSRRSPRGRYGPDNTVFNGYVLAGAAATLFTRSLVSTGVPLAQ